VGLLLVTSLGTGPLPNFSQVNPPPPKSNPALQFCVSKTFLKILTLFFQVMERESAMMRQGGPTIFSQAKHLVGVKEIADHILTAYKETVKH